uniref:Uncharacterized protein n=1 Tax=Oncorhynchus kisutch TaxID=8019 RepID=A0A8C7L456_ONCKI
ADSVGVDVIRQPSRSRIRRHTNRLSAVFQRVSPGDASMTDDPAELSNQITAPGILKIFGSEICQGANYKSVLATTHSSAKELVKEALERYGLNKEEAESYVLCDSIGYVGDHQWKTECFRVVGDNEKPLLLQSLWKPREGLARRFEIQRRASVEEKRSRDKDTVTAGINAQARKLQKSRSRVTSALIERRSVYVTSTLERGVLNGILQFKLSLFFSPQDFVIYLLNGSSTLIGRCGGEDKERSKVDFPLSAPDILPLHCCLCRHDHNDKGSTVRLRPFHSAMVTRNGETLSKEAELSPGDVIGMGRHYLFLFKDPTVWVVIVHILIPQFCYLTQFLSRRATACLNNPEGRGLNLLYVVEHEDAVVKEIVAMGSVHRDKPPLTVAFLLSVCVEHSATHLQTSDLRRLLLLIARSDSRSVPWYPSLCSDPEEQQPLNLAELVSGLRTLVVWMSNALELLYYIQQQMPQTLAWRSHREQGVEMRLSCVRLASEEAMMVLEEVIMLTFQQCVYYLTKTLYPILPSLLDSDPFRGSSGLLLREQNEPFLDSGGVQVPGETDQVLEVLTETSRLLQDCQLHHDISSQLLAYLFYFINASLFNTLMERGSEDEFYQWSRGVHISANLDLLLDWAQGSGLGDLVVEHLHTLSSAVNLLATPREQLMQSSWESLRCAFPSLSPAQLHHLLRGYSPATPWPPHWAPSDEDQLATQNTGQLVDCLLLIHYSKHLACFVALFFHCCHFKLRQANQQHRHSIKPMTT